MSAQGTGRETRQQLVNRLKSIEGHVRSIERMVDQDTYCIDILNQTHAVQSALTVFNRLILQRHLYNGVTMVIRSDDQQERERVINELLQVFDAQIRR